MYLNSYYKINPKQIRVGVYEIISLIVFKSTLYQNFIVEKNVYILWELLKTSRNYICNCVKLVTFEIYRKTFI